MKKFTRLLCTLLMLCAVGVANAAVFKDVIVNGDLNGTDLQCFAVNDFPSGSGASQHDVRVITDPADASNKCIVVRTNANPANTWDSQFFVVLPADQADLKVGDEIKLTMRVKADAAQSAGSQSHGQAPGAYNHWACVGTINFGTSWGTFTGSATVDGSMTKEGNMMRVIAFNLSEIATGNICYFDDIKLEVKRSKELSEINLNVARNSYCEEEDATNFVGKDGDAGGAFSTNFVDGKGVGGTKGIVVKSVDDAVNGWDTQFFITLPRKFYTGESFRLKFSYRADKEASAGTQSHCAPGDYIFYSAIGTINFTKEWKTFDSKVAVAKNMCTKDNGNGEAVGFQTIAFNLNDNTTLANNYYFDNIFIYLDEEDATYDDKALAEEIAAAGGGGENDPNVDPMRVAQAKERLSVAIDDAKAVNTNGASNYRLNILTNTISQAETLMDINEATVSWINNMIDRLESASDNLLESDPQPYQYEPAPVTYKGVKKDLKAAVDAALATLQANQNKPEALQNALATLIDQGNTILANDYSKMDQEEFEEMVNTVIDRIEAAEEALKNAKEATEEPEPVIANGTYWLYNEGAKKYMVGANTWGTRASVGYGGIGFNVEMSDGKYILRTSPMYNGNKSLALMVM